MRRTLADANDLTRVRAQARNDDGGMPALRGVQTPQQIADVSTDVATQIEPWDREGCVMRALPA